MRILITGASGYIGRNAIKHLLCDNSIEVYGIDIVDSKIVHENYTHYCCDISNHECLKNLPKDIDTVIHLAQSIHYRNFPEKANDIFNVNIISTQYLLDWSRENNTSQFIYSSTGNVYEEKEEALLETDLCKPNGYYGQTKYIAEQLIENYASFFKTTIIRLFGVYGPEQKNMLVPKIVNSIINGSKVTLAKNKGLVYTPIFIDDCVSLIEEILKKQISGTYNISNKEIVTIRDIVDITSKYLNIEPVIEATDKEPMFLIGDNSKILKSLNKEEFTCFDNGLKQYLDSIN